MIDSVLLKLAVTAENISIYLKRYLRRKYVNKFLVKYNLQDGKATKKSNIHYNPYEGTNVMLIEQLIQSGEIQRTDKILDIGCGAGIFLLYLADRGFQNLQGIEIDKGLLDVCRKNIIQYQNKSSISGQNIDVFQGDALAMDIDEDVNCFYLFNSFYDECTYLKWLEQVKASLHKKNRPIKIIVLFPTVASMGALKQCSWLREKTRVLCKAQLCHRCVYFLIYESVG